MVYLAAALIRTGCEYSGKLNTGTQIGACLSGFADGVEGTRGRVFRVDEVYAGMRVVAGFWGGWIFCSFERISYEGTEF